MTSQRSVNRDLGRLFIANFPDQNNIWVLSQNRSQGLSKVKASVGLNLNLFYTSNLVFNRIFNSNNFFIRSIKRFKNGVKRSGFAGTSRAGDNNHAGFKLNRSQNRGFGALIQAQLVERQKGFAGQ